MNTPVIRFRPGTPVITRSPAVDLPDGSVHCPAGYPCRDSKVVKRGIGYPTGGYWTSYGWKPPAYTQPMTTIGYVIDGFCVDIDAAIDIVLAELGPDDGVVYLAALPVVETI